MFLLRRMRQTGITNEQIRNIISSKLDLEASKIKQAGGGLINDVFFIETEKGEVVLRVSPGGAPWRPGFEGEQWALKQCSKKDIPVPEILAFGTVQTKLPHPCQYLLVERIPGKPLKEQLYLRREEIKSYYKEAGYLLSRIHTIRTESFGPLKSGGKGSFNSWKEFLLRHVNKGILDYLLEMKIISEGLKERILQVFNSEKAYLELKSPVLLHGDFSNAHIFIDKGKISGIIDLEDCVSGDPLYDLVSPELYCEIAGTPSSIPYFLEGYQNGFTNEELGRRLTFYKLQKTLPLIWWWKEERKELGRGLRVWRLSSLLKRYLRELE